MNSLDYFIAQFHCGGARVGSGNFLGLSAGSQVPPFTALSWEFSFSYLRGAKSRRLRLLVGNFLNHISNLSEFFGKVKFFFKFFWLSAGSQVPPFTALSWEFS